MWIEQTFSSRTAFSPLTCVRLLMSVFPCWHSVWRLLTSSLSFFSSRSPICKAFGVEHEGITYSYCVVKNNKCASGLDFPDCISHTTSVKWCSRYAFTCFTPLSFLRAAWAALRSTSNCFLQSFSSVSRASSRANLSWLLSLKCCTHGMKGECKGFTGCSYIVRFKVSSINHNDNNNKS